MLLKEGVRQIREKQDPKRIIHRGAERCRILRARGIYFIAGGHKMAKIHSAEHLKEQIAITKPDHVMFVPKQLEWESDNVHLYVVEHKKYGGMLAFWTQSTFEGTGNNHLVFAGSRDGGKSWSEPKFIIGSRAMTKDDAKNEAQASWGFPIVTRSGRIYLFYYRELLGVKDNSRQLTGAFSAIYSDDCGESWSESADIKQRLTPYDADEYIQDNIVYEVPMRGTDGKYLAGFTKYVSRRVKDELKGGCRVYFYRFDNIDDDPEIKDIKITTLPDDDRGIFVYRPSGDVGRIEEPAWVILPDGRIFCSMRTDLGAVYYSVSSDGGKGWSSPRALYFDDNTPFVNPISPCPIYDLGDGRYMQLYHGVCDPNKPYLPRNTLRCAIGHFDADAIQPIRFKKEDSDLYMHLGDEADGFGTDKQLAIYGTMTHMDGKNILWYPDRKFFLLGKDVR